MNLSIKAVRFFRGRLVSLLLLLVLCSVAFSNAIAPINSYDFWWHLKTGDYIIESGGVPDVDPFTYTALQDDPDSPGRPSFILKQYWLAQVLFSLVHSWFGLDGIIVLRGVVYAALVLLAGLFLHARGAWRPAAVTLPLLVLSSRVALEDSDRPQNFTYLIAFAIFLLIETAVRSGRRWLLFLNVPLLLILANMHGGFFAPVCYVIVYMVCALFEGRLKPLRREILLSGALACLVTYLNPNGWRVVQGMLALSSDSVVKGTAEFQSPFRILPYVFSNPGWLSFWFLVLLSLPAIVYFFKKGHYSLAFISASVVASSLLAMRFMFFMAPISVVVFSLFFEGVFPRRSSRSNALFICVSLLLCAYIVLRPWHVNAFGVKQQLYRPYYPVETADFVSGNPLPDRLFNFLGWGGYLEYRLWPKHQLFIDTRQLINANFKLYEGVMYYSEEGREALDRLGVSTVIVPAINIYTGEIFPLVRALYERNDWSLVHHDDVALVFARKGLFGKELAKSMVYYHVIAEVMNWQPYFPFAEGYQRSLSEAYSRLGLRR